MDAVDQDTSSAPPTVHRNRRRLVSRPSTRAGPGATRCAHATHCRALQLLRRERKRALSPARASRMHEGLAQVAEPEEPASEQDLGRVRRPAAALPAAAGVGTRTALVDSSTSRLDGRAGWCSSPRPALGRAPTGKLAGATRHDSARGGTICSSFQSLSYAMRSCASRETA